MNESLTNLVLHSINDIHLFQNYEICRQESQCYLLIPPPRPPAFPKFNLPSNDHSLTSSIFTVFGLFIGLTSTCLLLFLLNLKFQFYHKLRQYYCQTNDSNEPSPYSSIMPISYKSLTPSTITTNQSPLLTITQKSNQIFHSSFNSNHYYCSHPLTYYQQKHQITSYYYTHELSSSSNIVCQNCLFDSLHCEQRCLCKNFFVPIK